MLGRRRSVVRDDDDVDVADRDAETRRSGRGRRAAVGASGAAGAGLSLLAALVRLVAGLLALLIALGIALVVLDANSSNAIVSNVHDAAKALVGPFGDIFTPKDRKARIAINWGIALVIYLAIGFLVAGLLERIGATARSRADS